MLATFMISNNNEPMYQTMYLILDVDILVGGVI